MTKAACKRLCGGSGEPQGGGGITIVHTAARRDISPHSVTSFYAVGLAEGAYEAADLLAFEGEGDEE